MKISTTAVLLAAVIVLAQAHFVSYGNYFDNDPFNDYPVLMNGPVTTPIAHPASRISYSNFYDMNPYNDYPVIVENPAIPRVYDTVSNLHLDYTNFLDKNPYNDYVVVKNEPIVTTAWREPVVSYQNFYDANPFNDYAVINEDWDEVNYKSYETVETIVPPAYPVEHVEVYQPPPIENRYVEYIP